MKLFDEIPHLSNGHVILREIQDADADVLEEIAHDQEVGRYLPTFLLEKTQDDMHDVTQSMRDECLVLRRSLFLAVCLAEDPRTMLGIAEVYNHDESARKASVGCRLVRRYWHMGLATQTAGLLRDYLIDQAGLDMITAHVMHENTYSGKTLLKVGFELAESGRLEDWGFGEPVVVDKYVYERP